jgi:hypothetical protein
MKKLTEYTNDDLNGIISLGNQAKDFYESSGFYRAVMEPALGGAARS